MTTNSAPITRTLSRRTFAGTVTGSHGHRDPHGASVAVISGPVIVTVEVTQTRRADGVECWPSYSVKVDGWHRFGGCADHLPADGIPSLGWLTIGSELEAEQVAHLDDMTDVAAAASSYAAGRIIAAVDSIRSRRHVTSRDDLELGELLCDHVGEDVVERTAHGYLGDRPAGTVEQLCAACGTVLERDGVKVPA